jgi:hypothetical protein
MLVGENSRGNQDSHLVAIQDSAVGRANSDLCFSVAYVAADQSVHHPTRG